MCWHKDANAHSLSARKYPCVKNVLAQSTNSVSCRPLQVFDGAARGSMKIVGSGFCAGYGQRLYAFHFDGNDVVLILQAPFNQQKLVMHNDGMILFEKLRRDDCIGDACLIFEAEKHKALCGSGPLARNDGSGEADVRAVRKMFELDSGANPAPPQIPAMVSQGMRTDGHARASKIRDQSFFDGHWRKRRAGGRSRQCKLGSFGSDVRALF